ncbi:MAG: C40 family peptidase [Bacteroidia bacterium]
MAWKYFSAKAYIVLVVIVLLLSSCGSMRKANRAEESARADGSKRKRDKDLVEKYEKLLDININPETSLKLYKSVDAWMGVPYKYANATKKGTDCSGLVFNLYQEVYNIKLPRSTDDQYKLIDKVRKKNLQEGNLVFFKTERGRKVSHVGVYLGNNKFIHASTSKGVRIDDMTSDYYEKNYVGGGLPKP